MIFLSILLILFILAYIFIIEVFTLLFRFTGISEEQARFQVISLLTSSGFTTSHSEAITKSKERRNIAMITMIFGYTFTVIIVALIINLILEMNKSELSNLSSIALFFVGVFIIISILLKLHVKKYIDLIVNKIYVKLSSKRHNKLVIIDYFHDNVIASLYLTTLCVELNDTMIKDSILNKYCDIKVLAITRSKHLIKHTTGDTIIKANDTLLLYGKESEIKKIFELV